MNLFSDGLRLGTLSSKYIPLTQVVNILSPVSTIQDT